MNLIHDVPFVGYGNTGALRPSDTRSQDQHLAENRRDHLVANGLLFTSLSGLLAVVAAICTTSDDSSWTRKRFRYLLNEDAMATEKTVEGIRKFAADIAKLEKFIASKIN